MPDVKIQNKISINDCIVFDSQCGLRLGMVIDESFDNVKVLIFDKVTSDVSTQHSFKPLAAADYPMAYHGHMQEV
jgi:hypothetical protein